MDHIFDFGVVLKRIGLIQEMKVTPIELLTQFNSGNSAFEPPLTEAFGFLVIKL